MFFDDEDTTPTDGGMAPMPDEDEKKDEEGTDESM